jgi:hypothetical protein
MRTRRRSDSVLKSRGAEKAPHVASSGGGGGFRFSALEFSPTATPSDVTASLDLSLGVGTDLLGTARWLAPPTDTAGGGSGAINLEDEASTALLSEADLDAEPTSLDSPPR